MNELFYLIVVKAAWAEVLEGPATQETYKDQTVNFSKVCWKLTVSAFAYLKLLSFLMTYLPKNKISLDLRFFTKNPNFLLQRSMYCYPSPWSSASSFQCLSYPFWKMTSCNSLIRFQLPESCPLYKLSSLTFNEED